MTFDNFESCKEQIKITSDMEVVTVYLSALMSCQEEDELESEQTLHKNMIGCDAGDVHFFTHCLRDIDRPYGHSKRVTTLDMIKLREHIVHYWRQF